MESQRKYSKYYSFEFFPPKNDAGAEKLRQAREALSELNPALFTVTFGAGGSTRDRTFDTVVEIKQQSNIDVAPHLSCISGTSDSIREILNQYKEQGIRHLVALRGDLPSGMGTPGEFRYAKQLVKFIRQEHGDYFHIEVAAYPEFHPQASGAGADLKHFKRKVEAGADGAMTQYFYSADAYFRFIDSCEQMGIDLPIVPGIMPITNYKQLARFSDACGAEIPRWIRKRLEDFGDDMESLRRFGTDVTTRLCQELLEGGAPGLHFYTLNQAGPSMEIWRNLGIVSENKLAKA